MATTNMSLAPSAFASTESDKLQPCPAEVAADLTVQPVNTGRGGVLTSKLTFERATAPLQGTYLCSWRWGEESRCLLPGEDDDEKLVADHGQSHSQHRSATLFVRIYRFSEHDAKHLTVIATATAGLAVVLAALAFADSRLERCAGGGAGEPARL